MHKIVKGQALKEIDENTEVYLNSLEGNASSAVGTVGTHDALGRDMTH